MSAKFGGVASPAPPAYESPSLVCPSPSHGVAAPLCLFSWTKSPSPAGVTPLGLRLSREPTRPQNQNDVLSHAGPAGTATASLQL